VGTSLHHLGESDDSHGVGFRVDLPPARDAARLATITRNVQVCGMNGLG
jgi:hypothetical protein